MQEEYEALIKQGTWKLVPYPPEANLIGSQWIFKIKRHSYGTISRYKARLVANGNQQAAGVDFAETFSPVIKQPTFQVVLAIALQSQWPIRQLDVSNVFLHGTIYEDVFMKPPRDNVDPKHPDYVCKLTKPLYGLWQAPRASYSMLSQFLETHEFVQSQANTSLFVLKTPQHHSLYKTLSSH